MTKQSIIQLNHICAAYERKKVLEDINLTVYEKDFLGVIGPNGGGKTTLIKIILGLLHPISGDIRFYHEGKEVQEISMGYLPQYSSIDKKFPISVYDVVLSGLNRQKALLRSFTAQQHEQVKKSASSSPGTTRRTRRAPAWSTPASSSATSPPTAWTACTSTA